MKLSIFCQFGLKTPIPPRKKLESPKWEAMSTKLPNGTSTGRNGSRGVLVIIIIFSPPAQSRRQKN